MLRAQADNPRQAWRAEIPDAPCRSVRACRCCPCLGQMRLSTAWWLPHCAFCPVENGPCPPSHCSQIVYELLGAKGAGAVTLTGAGQAGHSLGLPSDLRPQYVILFFQCAPPATRQNRTGLAVRALPTMPLLAVKF